MSNLLIFNGIQLCVGFYLWRKEMFTQCSQCDAQNYDYQRRCVICLSPFQLEEAQTYNESSFISIIQLTCIIAGIALSAFTLTVWSLIWGAPESSAVYVLVTACAILPYSITRAAF